MNIAEANLIHEHLKKNSAISYLFVEDTEEQEFQKYGLDVYHCLPMIIEDQFSVITYGINVAAMWSNFYSLFGAFIRKGAPFPSDILERVDALKADIEKKQGVQLPTLSIDTKQMVAFVSHGKLFTEIG